MRVYNASPKSHTHKKSGSSSKAETSFKKLTMGFQSYKQIKQAHLKKQICDDYINDAQDNKQCTFQPHLISSQSKNIQNRRSLKKFLQDQQKYTNQKKKKIEQLRNQIIKSIEQQNKYKPMIDSNSHRISTQNRQFKQSTSQNDVFQRLSKQKKIVHDIYEEEQIFSPKICLKSRQLKRDKDVSNLLYDDALRRQQKQQLNIAQFLKKQFIPNVNNNTNDLVMKKIYHQFVTYISENISSSIQQSQISPLLAINILSQIFNVDLNPNKSQQQQKLCQKVLFYIANTKTQMVNIQILWNFIQTIINGHLITSNFNEKEQNQIVQNFSHFYKKRLTKPKKTITPEKCTFRPKTLKSSQKLAQNYRQKTLQSVNQYLQTEKVNIQIVNNGVRIEDLFIIEKMKKNAQNQRKRIQKYNAQLQQCSFKPNLSLTKKKTENISQKRKITLIIPKSTKTQQLQKKYKIKQKNQQLSNKQNEERIRTMYDSTSRQKSVYESTMRSRKKQQMSSEKPEVKNIDKNILRLTLARKNRQFKNALNQRGYPENVQNWESFRKQLKKQIQKSSQKLLKGTSQQKNIQKLKNSSSFMKK